MNVDTVKEQILDALSHAEAEEGLYLDNILYVHEEEERPRVEASEIVVLDLLKELISEGKIKADESGEKVVFRKA